LSDKLFARKKNCCRSSNIKAAGVIDGTTMKKTEELAKPALTAELPECFSCLEG
jgi:hypothetical protein